jgi:hypothetical protein
MQVQLREKLSMGVWAAHGRRVSVYGQGRARAGFGIVYTGTPQYNLSGGAAAASNPIGQRLTPDAKS